MRRYSISYMVFSAFHIIREIVFILEHLHIKPARSRHQVLIVIVSCQLMPDQVRAVIEPASGINRCISCLIPACRFMMPYTPPFFSRQTIYAYHCIRSSHSTQFIQRAILMINICTRQFIICKGWHISVNFHYFVCSGSRFHFQYQQSRIECWPLL